MRRLHWSANAVMVDGVFEAVPGDANPAAPTGVIFHPTMGLDEMAVAQVRAAARTRILRAFVGPRPDREL